MLLHSQEDFAKEISLITSGRDNFDVDRPECLRPQCEEVRRFLLIFSQTSQLLNFSENISYSSE